MNCSMRALQCVFAAKLTRCYWLPSSSPLVLDRRQSADLATQCTAAEDQVVALQQRLEEAAKAQTVELQSIQVKDSSVANEQ